MGNKKYGLSCGDPQTLYLWLFIYNVSNEIFLFLQEVYDKVRKFCVHKNETSRK